jgi:bisphosphoglycerate-independent phosphoglycerate mutase (AlkP superfamily)
MNSLQNGYNQKFSGNAVITPYPATLTVDKTRTSHSSGYFYDTHIPVLFYGNGTQKGVSKKRYDLIDITTTIANLLQIEAPNLATGKIIDETFK